MSAEELNDSLCEEDLNGDDVLRILVATDNHLGYAEKHTYRGEDSFLAFEEILKLAVQEDVDFILLGGDLFHDCKPTPYTIFKCSQLIRRYCFGDKPVKIEFLSDQSYHFKHLINPIVNYEDPNLNISIPIFSIHGNHDDPTGTKSISALDLLSTNGLVNYFGRHDNYAKIEVIPMLLQKGSTKVAIYGLSHIHDQRLARTFRDGGVYMVQPEGDDWFHLLVLHQNRVARGANNFIPSASIPKFMHLAIWGHEHDCYIEPQAEDGVYISQPGSSVATSMSEGESMEKKVGLLLIKNNKFHLRSIPLKSVRPFIFKTMVLDDPAESNQEFNGLENMSMAAMNLVSKEIDSIIRSNKQSRIDQKLPPILPLIRIVVRFHEEGQQFNAIRLSQEYANQVANTEDIVLQKRKVLPRDGAGRRNKYMNDTHLEDLDTAEERATHIADLVQKEMERKNKQGTMNVLSLKGLNEAVSRSIERNDTDALIDLISLQIKMTRTKMKEIGTTPDKIDTAIEFLHEQRSAEGGDTLEMDEITKMFEEKKRQAKLEKSAKGGAAAKNSFNGDEDDIEMISDDDKPVQVKPARGRGRGRGSRGSRIKK